MGEPTPLTGKAPGRAAGVPRRVVGRLLRPVLARSRQPGLEALSRVEEIDRSLLPLRVAVQQWHAEEDDFRAGEVNLELFKAEIRSLDQTLQLLGQAIAPEGGLSEAADALANVRWRITECERRVRSLEAGGAAESASRRLRRGPRDGRETPTPPADGSGFDRAAFDRQFGAPPDEAKAELADRYAELLRDHSPVLVLGSGRGDLLDVLGEHDVTASGVDDDPARVEEARLRGHEVVGADPIEFLESQPPGILGAITAVGLLEHLPLDALIRLLELSARRLRPGGVFIAQTPNPTSLVVLGDSYLLDPTNIRPLHPKLLEFLCESAGFRHIEVRFYRPATAMQVGLLDESASESESKTWVGQVNRAFGRLNDVLFGPQDFAVIAVTDDTRGQGGT